MEIVGGEARLKSFYTIRYDSATVVLSMFSAGAMLTGVALGISNGDPTLAIGGGVMLLILLGLGWPARYGLTNDQLKWHHGVAVNKSIALSQIDRIMPDDARSGMTLGTVSGHRIYAGKQRFFVSAANHEELMQALLARCPHLRKYGYEWRREVDLAASEPQL